MDIATLLETHRRYMLELAQEPYNGGETLTDDEARGLTWAHDRATTRTLLDMYRTSQGTGQPATATNTVTLPVTSRKVKAGSKKAKDRALKAGETRRRNLAAKQSQVHSAGNSNNSEVPPMDNVKLAASGEGGAA